PSPITTVPSIAIASNARRIASIAAMSAAVSSPSPMNRADARAAASVTRTTSRARFRSIGAWTSAVRSATEQPVPAGMGVGNEDALLARVALVVAARDAPRLLLVGGDVDHEGHRIARVRLQRAGRRVVGHDEHAPFAAHRAQPLEDGAHDLLVEVLDRLDLLVRIAHVAALVGRLHVQEEEVAGLEGAKPVLRLAAEVRVEEAGGPGDGDALEPRQHAETVHQIDRGDDRAVDAEALAERRDRGPLPLPPEPDRVRRPLAPREPRPADRVLREQATGAVHQARQHARALPLGEGPADRLVGEGVRRGGAHAVLATAPDQEEAGGGGWAE